MAVIFSSLAAIFVTLPVLLYILIFILTKQLTNNHRKAKSAAMNATTIVLIFSVHFLILAIWAKSLIWIIFLFMLITAIVFTYIYWKIREEIVYPKVFLGYWRLNFLLFSVLYIALLLYGAATRAIQAVLAT
ncbi:DUF3397 domain-containing protein [Lederbergia citrea]|uniref:DUF3397 domain-containing protein n=1 Tax=Lederbergia citrea TaxID=2833581 RepID=A0A942UMA4_9BACI|nr:DUF3397 domain-containing protein [Lederbergia citrea]MBS4177221.1 DUF3397 domain-containing protein [Lederbergia citrea]MBS4203884.1 DUF3397 domain-containing protein [Lederbergia citrea]MBS4221531.1 DUF3397 domain-containing protein [Lederbergia citrea]